MRVTRRWTVISVATLAIALALPSIPASAAPDGDRYALGDSVMLGAKSNLKARGFSIVDAAVSRQAYSGPALLRKRGESLPKDVVIHLGTNGTFPLDVCKKIVKAAGKERRVFLVTVHVKRSWTKGNNAVIRDCAASFRAGRVTVVDWDWAASRHPEWLYSDGAHLNPAGAKAFARIISQAIERADAAAVAPAPGTVPASTQSGSAGSVGSPLMGASGTAHITVR
ncbi:MAG: hypothetical protein Q7V58_14465 [Actinomycetota bacterium]|nr:hypothetical protein [Actinomycetota bacterium]